MVQEQPTPEAIRLYKEVLLDPALRELREGFCRAAAGSLESIAGWLGVDSFIGGGDVPRSPSAAVLPNPERYSGFRALAAVIEMASELATQAIMALDQGHRFAASVVIRQLLETEYLLTAFATDFSEAARWAHASPEDIRRSFTPSAMRSLGGFSNHEYWQHCDMGGHPTPTGRSLLRFNLAVPPSDDEFLTATVWGDLAQHLRRVWARADLLLRGQHARYAVVRENDSAEVQNAEKRWADVDPLATSVDFKLLNALAKQISETGPGELQQE